MTTEQNNQANHDAAIEAERAKASFVFREDVAPGLRLEMDLRQIFFAGVSEFQQIEVIETYFGKVRTKRTFAATTIPFFHNGF